MSDFRFESPQYVFALWGVAVLSALLIWLEFKRGGALRRLVAATMQPRLVVQGSRPQRLASIGL